LHYLQRQKVPNGKRSMNHRVFKLLISSVFILSLSGCSVLKMLEHGTMQEPELTYQDYEITDLGLDKVALRLIFKASNPNEHDIDTFFTDYELFIHEKSVVKGENLKVSLIPQGESIMAIPIELEYDNLFATAGTLATLMQQGKKEVESRVNIRIHGEFYIHQMFGKRYVKPYSYSVNVNTDIPLPEVTVDIVKDAVKDSVNDLFGFKLFSDETLEQRKAKFSNPMGDAIVFYDFHFFAFDAAYDSRRVKELVPDIEDYDGLIYGTSASENL